MSSPQRIIGHLDMDAFFAAIEERDTPRFRGLPLVVGADPKHGNGRGVVSTANYPARAYGIRSALPITTAWRLSEAARKEGKPAVIFLSGNHRRYEEVSQRIMARIRIHMPVVQQRSVDEAYVDLCHAGSFEHAAVLCQRLKDDIYRHERLTASVGIGPNKLVAKIASDAQKPNGLTIVTDAHAQSFLDPLPIRSVPGVGPKTELLLRNRGIRTIQDARMVPQDLWSTLLGKWGEALSEKVHGRDASPLRDPAPAKSVSEQHTFSHDTLEASVILERLFRLCADVMRRLSEEGAYGFRTVAVTVRFFTFETTSRSRTHRLPLRTLRDLQRDALALLLPFLDRRENPRQHPVRLIGVRVEKLLRSA
ncbi:MAG: DNA polymerase IV [Parcubacteria group bacterium Gr01-1014_106]|nr:MAG: DNA polymerase IV [Parcubacteria group bacterium Gr01-1014_106]